MMPRHALILAPLLGACAVDCGAATLFKCLQDNGRPAYQSEPCADPAKQSTLEVKTAPASDPRTGELLTDKDARQAEEQARIQVERVTETLASFAGCGDDVPGFEERHAQAFEQWKQRNAKALGRFQEDEQARRAVETRIETARRQPRPADAKARAARLESCEKLASAFAPPPAK